MGGMNIKVSNSESARLDGIYTKLNSGSQTIHYPDLPFHRLSIICLLKYAYKKAPKNGAFL
ncbi:hypothetical protein SAMN05216605_10232 [Pseudomonas abietaniphila]|uniref:Uncharacterized protein n=1 Tax=Pseudomonas abietaniphila TaxID=89065 RepID=A0A1G7U3A6_9PSED|nr:hypothetical protein SAMN05216605_10232 [Pseudomonas abietaniphila]